MRKGDLVVLRQKNPHFNWDDPGVILRGPREGQVHVHLVSSGKNVGTEISIVVDVMVSGKIFKGVPTSFLERVS